MRRDARLSAAPMPRRPFARARRAAAVVFLLPFLLTARAFGEAGGPAQPVLIAEHGRGRLWKVGEQRLLRLEGSPYEMGMQHGRMLPEGVRECVQFFLDDFAVAQRNQSRESLAAIWKELEPHVPRRYLDELRGMADGSGVPLADLQLVHAIPEKFHCSGAAAYGKATKDGKLYHTRSLDYSLKIGKTKTVQENALVIVYIPDEGIPHLNVGWAGFAGCVSGMNARGLSVGEMGSSSKGEHHRGIPMIFMVREVLHGAASLDQAVDITRKLPRTCGFNFIYADANAPAAAALEVNKDFVKVFPAGDPAENVGPHFAIDCCVRRVNHFVDKDLAAVQRTDYDPRRSAPFSWLGYAQISDYLKLNYGRLDAERMIGLLRTYPPDHACLHQAVFAPGDGECYVSVAHNPGVPRAGAQNQTFYRYRMKKVIAGDPGPVETYPAPGGDGASGGRGAERGRAPAERGFRVPMDGAPAKTQEFLKRFDRLGTEFAWELGPGRDSGWGYALHALTFPSPTPSPHERNNTVHADYYRPVREGRVPAVIVLDILDGSNRVAGLVSDHLAKHGIAALAVRMAYFGERRLPPEEQAALRSRVDLLADSVCQSVTDIGRAAVWLRQRPEIDPDRVGLCGVSLGGIVAALAAGVYGKEFPRSALIMAGGDVADVFWNGTETARAKAGLEAQGYTQERLTRELEAVDPCAYASRVPRGTVFMVNGTQDTVVSPANARKLWEALGKPAIRWYDAGHYTMMWRVLEILQRVSDLFGEPTWGAIPAEETPAAR